MPNVIIGLTDIVLAVLLCCISLPLVKHKIKMNRWYGIRIPKAYTCDANWYTINEYGGRQLILWSIPQTLIGIAILLAPPLSVNAILLTTLTPLFLAVPLINIFRFSKTL